MRSLSSAALKAMFSEETGDYPIMLLTIAHATLPTPVRVSSDPTQRLSATDTEVVYGTVSRSTQYIWIPFQLTLPGESDDSTPRAAISIDNVSRELTSVIRNLDSPPTVGMELVMASSPDVVEAAWPDFDVSPIDMDELSISGTLTLDLLIGEPFPGGTMTPGYFPALF